MTEKKSWFFSSTVRWALGGVLAACLWTPFAQAQQQPQVLRIGLSANVTSIDPHFHNVTPNNNVAEHLFDKLLRFGEDGSSLRPGLATQWRAVDGTTWEFNLRPGVRFHDGEEFTADDVVFSLQRVGRLANNPGGFVPFVRDIVAMETPDRHTVRLRTANPLPLLPNYVASIYIVSRKAAATASGDDFNAGKAAVGTGPFKLAGFSRGERVELLRNEDYWGAKPAWSQVSLRIITSDSARLASLLSGEVQAIENIPTSDLDRVRRFGRLYGRTSNRLIYLATDQDRDASPFVTHKDGAPLDRNPLKDPRVRQALSKAIDRQAIVERVMAGQATAAGQIVPPGMAGHDAGILPEAFDPVGARRLLAEAGYPEGFGLTLHGPNDRYVNDDAILQTVAAMWNRVGVAAKVEAQPMAAFFSRARQRQTSAYLLGLAPSSSEATGMLRAMLGTFDEKRGMGALNFGRYGNPRLDALVERAQSQMLGPDDLQKTLLEATGTAARDHAVFPLHWQFALWGTAPDLSYAPRADELTLAHEFKRR